MRWTGIVLASLLVACGKTSKDGGGAPTDPDLSSGGAPAVADAPNCAVSIASDRSRHCAAYQDGSVWCWGTTVNLDADAPTQDATPVRVLGVSGASRVFMAERSSCALTKDGLWCWGGPFTDEPTRVTIGGGQPIRDVGIDREQLCVIDVVSHVYCQSAERQLQVDVAGGPLTRFAGPGSDVIDDDGRVFDLGVPEHPLLRAEARTNNYAAGYGTPSCWLKRSGSLWCTDYSFDVPGHPRFEPRLGENVVQVGVGDLFKCALTKDGRVWCEGLNNTGQTGQTGTDFAFGDFIPALTDVRQLSVGFMSSCALQSNGSVRCWGAYDGTSSYALREVTSCEGQRAPLEPTRIVAPPLPGAHVAEAGRARAQTLCTCAQGPSASDECELAEDRTPNGACLDSLLPGDANGGAVSDCLLENLLAETSCYSPPNCPGDGTLPQCVAARACEGAAGIRSYCQRRQCSSDSSVFVSSSQVCDGHDDCEDGSDERNCAGEAGRFDCGDGNVIDVSTVCDGSAQCADASDEAHCSNGG